MMACENEMERNPSGAPKSGHPGLGGNRRPGSVSSSAFNQPQFALFHLLLFSLLSSFGNLGLVFFPGHRDLLVHTPYRGYFAN